MIVGVTRQTGITPSNQYNFQYNAQSLQKVYIGLDGATASKAYDFSITVAIGNRTIVNNVSAWGLGLINAYQVGGFNADESTSTESCIGLNLGSHVCGKETIYITINTSSTLAGTPSLRVALLVNEPVQSAPLQISEYSDSSFADTNTLQAFLYSTSSLSGSLGNVEIRNQSFSTTAQINAFALASACDGFIDQPDFDRLAVLMNSRLPLSTTFNNGSANSIITISAMLNSPEARRGARVQAQAVRNSMTPEERRAL